MKDDLRLYSKVFGERLLFLLFLLFFVRSIFLYGLPYKSLLQDGTWRNINESKTIANITNQMSSLSDTCQFIVALIHINFMEIFISIL
jgi:hypothetical protein